MENLRPGRAGTPAPLTPVFSYRQWSITNPEEERPILRINFQEGRQLRVICPEPSCLSERYAPTTVGIVVETGENGKSSCLAVPCADHAGSFNFSDGWYRRFADARRQRQLGDGGAAGSPELPEMREPLHVVSLGMAPGPMP